MSSGRTLSPLSVQAIAEHMSLETRHKLSRHSLEFQRDVKFVPWNFEKVEIVSSSRYCQITLNSCMRYGIFKQDENEPTLFDYAEPGSSMFSPERYKINLSFEKTCEYVIKFLFGDGKKTTMVKDLQWSNHKELERELVTAIGNSRIKVSARCHIKLHSNEFVSNALDLKAPTTTLKVPIDKELILSIYKHFCETEPIYGTHVKLFGKCQSPLLELACIAEFFDELTSLKPRRGLTEDKWYIRPCIILPLPNADFVIGYDYTRFGCNMMHLMIEEPYDTPSVAVDNWVRSEKGK